MPLRTHLVSIWIIIIAPPHTERERERKRKCIKINKTNQYLAEIMNIIQGFHTIKSSSRPYFERVDNPFMNKQVHKFVTMQGALEVHSLYKKIFLEKDKKKGESRKNT